MPTILVVDDVRPLAEQYAYDLARIGGYETRIATSGREALETIAFDVVDCVILDLEMPDVDGFDVLRSLKRDGFAIPVIVYTGTGSYERCVQAVKLGAVGFIDKSAPMQRVVNDVESALQRARLEAEVRTMRRDLDPESALVGSSAPMRDLRERIERVAAIPSTVLIVGESGTGKEIVAREIHRLGSRREGPFVTVNSAALPENLVESELFGHERGAFTGANRSHRGAFEQASGGTLFLDEIGELAPSVQAKLLRVLEQSEVSRLGAERTIKVDTRVVTATHRDLESEVEGGRFRRDLYFRINVHAIRVPPLREHRSDIPELVNHFLTHTCARFGVARKRLDRGALDVLMAYEWKRNNVRELRNVIERMVLAADGDALDVSAVPHEIRAVAAPATSPGSRTLRDLRREAEREIVVAALEAHRWNVTRAAEELGLTDHASLLKVMRRLGLKRR